MAEHYKVDLGLAIRQRREELGLTQKQLAERTHHQEAQTVSRWERGENAPADLEIVADALEWTIADLVAGIRPPNARTGRKLGYDPGRELTQLDRIEHMLSDIHAILTGDARAKAPELAGLADRLLSADESPQPKAAGRPKTPRARPKRTVA